MSKRRRGRARWRESRLPFGMDFRDLFALVLILLYFGARALGVELDDIIVSAINAAVMYYFVRKVAKEKRKE